MDPCSQRPVPPVAQRDRVGSTVGARAVREVRLALSFCLRCDVPPLAP